MEIRKFYYTPDKQEHFNVVFLKADEEFNTTNVRNFIVGKSVTAFAYYLQNAKIIEAIDGYKTGDVINNETATITRSELNYNGNDIKSTLSYRFTDLPFTIGDEYEYASVGFITELTISWAYNLFTTTFIRNFSAIKSEEEQFVMNSFIFICVREVGDGNYYIRVVLVTTDDYDGFTISDYKKDFPKYATLKAGTGVTKELSMGSFNALEVANNIDDTSTQSSTRHWIKLNDKWYEVFDFAITEIPEPGKKWNVLAYRDNRVDFIYIPDSGRSLEGLTAAVSVSVGENWINVDFYEPGNEYNDWIDSDIEKCYEGDDFSLLTIVYIDNTYKLMYFVGNYSLESPYGDFYGDDNIVGHINSDYIYLGWEPRLEGEAILADFPPLEGYFETLEQAADPNEPPEPTLQALPLSRGEEIQGNKAKAVTLTLTLKEIS